MSFVFFCEDPPERWLIKRDDYHWMGNIKLSPILLRRTINWQGWRGCRVQGSLNLEPAESKGTKFRAKIWDVTGLDIDQPPSAQPPRRGVGGTRALAHSIIIIIIEKYIYIYTYSLGTYRTNFPKNKCEMYTYVTCSYIYLACRWSDSGSSSWVSAKATAEKTT